MPTSDTATPPAIGRPSAAEQSAQLWRMSAAERERAMWDGELSLHQLTEWARRRRHEVPRLQGEFGWITITTPPDSAVAPEAPSADAGTSGHPRVAGSASGLVFTCLMLTRLMPIGG